MTDTFEKLSTKFDKIDHIVHVSDVHIRLTKRHEEYREAFSKFYSEVDKTPENTIIINTGDIFHSKVDLSPEAVQLGSEHLKKCADLRPTIIIAGNHDCLLTNATRLDSISPIVDALNHTNLFYLKESKLYGFANILINNMSVFDDPTKFVRMKDVTKKLKLIFDCKIALYHGGVLNAKTDIGYQVTDKTITNGLFDGHDMTLLGDIHMAQTLQEYDENNETPIIRYAGSLIQQNHGEALLGHGFSMWNVKQRSYTHVEIPNDYGYFTIDIEDGNLVTDTTNLPKRPKLRVRCKESVASDIKRIVNDIKKKYDISDISYMRIDGDSFTKNIISKATTDIQKITDVDYQNKLINDWLKSKYPEIMDKDTLESVLKINSILNGELVKDDASKNIRWKPVRFEFSNMFSYGENNILDFTKLDDVYGLFAANASGKSSLMDALCFTIFDKSARAFKAAHVLNTQKMSFSGKFTFEINGTTYVIEREGKRDKKNNVKVDVDFYKIEKDEKISLNSEARRSTNEIIRDYLGSYEDFILTSVALQGNQGSLIDMGQSERKELLSQFIGLNVFESLSAAAGVKLRELSGAVKLFNKEVNNSKLESLKNESSLLELKLNDLSSQRDGYTEKKKLVEINIETQQSNIIKLGDVPTSIDTINSERKLLVTKKVQSHESVRLLETEIFVKKQEYDDMLEKNKNFSTDLKEKVDEYSELVAKKQKLEQQMDKLKFVVKEKLKKIDHLANHQYDPNCKYCCNNSFVKDAMSAKDSLEVDKKEATELNSLILEVKAKISGLEPCVEEYKSKTELQNKINLLSATISKKDLEKVHATGVFEKCELRIKELDKQVELFEKSKEIIENNKVITGKINALKSQLNDIATKLKGINTEHVNAYARRTSVLDQIKSIEEQILKIESYENDIAAYQYYMESVGKDGIPYKIIADAVPRIEQLVNNILSQIVEFTIGIETDGKNVNVSIIYDDKKWPLELSSGMERFISALALRVSLINISNLPRANFLLVDEGFGALDASNMAMVYSLFDYLKSNFDFIIIISHLDAMRDMVNKQLEIKKENGFSKIDNTV